MSRMNRRRFTWVATSGVASAALVACNGDAVTDDLTPTQIPDAAGAPTLAPHATPFTSEEAEDGEEQAAAGAGDAIELEAQDPFDWSMHEFEAAPGQDIHVVNAGSLQHNFVVDEWGIETALLNGGEEDTATVPDDAEVGSQVEFYCSVPGHREGGMEGTITVVEAGAAEEAVAEDDEEVADEEGGEDEEVAAGAGEPIAVEGLDTLQFEPSSFEAAPGQEIHFVNAGSLQHDFVVDEIDLATEVLDGGGEETLTVPEDAEPGEYTFYCSVPGHREGGMEGTITITDGGGSAASDEETASTADASDEASAVSANGGVIVVDTLDSLVFEPSEFEAAPGQEILVVNVGSLQHDFVVDEWGLATTMLNGGMEEQITVPADAEVGSTVVFYCSVPGHQIAGMEGRLTVVEGDGTGAATADDEEPEEVAPDEATPETVEAPALDVDDNAIRVSTLDSMKFAPSHFSAAPGQQIYLVNPGVLIHDIVVDEWGLDSGALGGGEETVLNIPDDVEVGTEVEFYCSVPGHRESGMVGMITVIESEFVAGATPAPGGTPETESAVPAIATPADEAVIDGEAV